MIQEQIQALTNSLPEKVQLVAVSKTKPVEDIQIAYNAGQRVFGENKAQELLEKQAVLPNDILWHFIGHLQTNKVKYIAPFVHLIHSIDSEKILIEVNKEAKKNNRTISCLLQFHIAQEESKFGFSFEEVKEMLESDRFIHYSNIQIIGIMGMASFTENEELIREEFQTLHDYFHILKSHYFKFNTDFKEISMGMSGDYKIAIEQGSTMIRLGSTIFGSR